MKRFIESTVNFFRTFRSCVETAARDTEDHYHIPKSRFKDPDHGLSAAGEAAPTGRFLGLFHILRGCVSTAWEESDSQYHIPKTRFRESGGNGKGFKSPPMPETAVLEKAGFVGSGAWSVRPEIQTAGKTPEEGTEPGE